MDVSVQELINKTEKLDVNPENLIFSTNWCDIPMEMRAECIKRMDFKTRTRLGATSHTEKSLVEAKKYHFDTVKLVYSDCVRDVLYVIADKKPKGEVRLETRDNHEKTLNCAVQLLKKCEIDTFEFSSKIRSQSDLTKLWAELSKCAPFRFKTFKSRGNDPKGALYILKNCEFENILLNNTGRRSFNLLEFVGLQSVLNAKLFEFRTVHQSEKTHQLIQKWIDTNAKVGKTARFEYSSFQAFDSFAAKFGSRLIYKKDTEIRLRTNDESKHIFLYKQHNTYVTCTVIPSNLLESEYEKDDQWVSDMRSDDAAEYTENYHNFPNSEDDFSFYGSDDDYYGYSYNSWTDSD